MTPSMMHERNRNLEKRLMAYSLAASAVLLGADRAHASIQYTDVIPDAVLNTDGATYDIVFSGQTKFRVSFSRHSYRSYKSSFWSTTTFTQSTTTAFTTTTPTTTTVPVQHPHYNTHQNPHYNPHSTWTTTTRTYNAAGIRNFSSYSARFGADSASGDANPLSAGAVIDSGLPIQGVSNSSGLGNASLQSGSLNGGWGNFRGQDKYLGLKFQLVDGTHYGWARIEVANDVSQVIIKEFAYEDTPGLGIKAGEKDVSLAVSLNAFTAAVVKGGVGLNWTTQSETDNLGFILERMEIDADGKTVADWAEIASYKTVDALKGAGTHSGRMDYSFTDVHARKGARYEYRLSDMDTKGKAKAHLTVRVDASALAIPEAFVVEPNYPNPFNPETTIGFSLPEESDVKVTIYNLEGQTVAVLADGKMDAGYHSLKWNASNLGSGTYLYEVRAGEHREVRKMMLTR